MSPIDVLRVLLGAGVDAEIVNTGGGCGAVSVAVPGGCVLVTPSDGPWAVGVDDGVPVERDVWAVSMWLGDDASWVDALGVRDGDATVPGSGVLGAVRLLDGLAVAAAGGVDVWEL